MGGLLYGPLPRLCVQAHHLSEMTLMTHDSEEHEKAKRTRIEGGEVAVLCFTRKCPLKHVRNVCAIFLVFGSRTEEHE